MGDFSSAIDAVLALRDRDAFMLAAADLDDRRGTTPFQERPEPLGMLGGLWGLYFMVSADGIGKFLAEPEGSAFHETIAWCEHVGAEEMADCLREVAALHPDGEVPVDDDERYFVLEELESRRPRALKQIARRYATALDDLADRVHDWLSTHRPEVERALEDISREPPPDDAGVDLVAVKAMMARLEREVGGG